MGLNIAVIGCGAAAVGLIKKALGLDAISPLGAVDVFEQSVIPGGNIHVVAPWHDRLRDGFTQRFLLPVLADDRVRYFGNVSVGRDLPMDALFENYHLVVAATGAPRSRPLDIPGKNLAGVVLASDLVRGYQGIDGAEPIALDAESAVVIGMGNVAMDVVMYLAHSRAPALLEKLAQTPVSPQVIEGLKKSKIRDVHVLVRRTPAFAACTTPVFKELIECEGVATEIHGDWKEGPEPEDKSAQWICEQLEQLENSSSPNARVTVHFHFLSSPIEVVGENGRCTAVKIVENTLEPQGEAWRAVSTDRETSIEAGLVVPAIRYEVQKLSGWNSEGNRVLPPSELTDCIPLVVGWASTGADGILASQAANAGKALEGVIEELAALATRVPKDADGIGEQVASPAVTSAGWQHLWEELLRRGKELGKPLLRMSDQEALEWLRQEGGSTCVIEPP